jgi:hypothetical protein
MLKHHSKISRDQKLKVIQNLLSGVIDLTQYRAPRSYQVFACNGQYEVTGCLTDNQDNQLMVLNEEQYKAWHETLGEQDVLFIIRWDEYTQHDEQLSPSQHLAKYDAERLKELEQEVQTIAPKTEPVKTPKKSLRIDPVSIEETITVNKEVFVMPRSGKLSQYGETWRIKNN